MEKVLQHVTCSNLTSLVLIGILLCQIVGEFQIRGLQLDKNHLQQYHAVTEEKFSNTGAQMEASARKSLPTLSFQVQVSKASPCLIMARLRVIQHLSSRLENKNLL
jgi:hypothetical protein